MISFTDNAEFKFRPVTSLKYLGDNGYMLIKCRDDSFCIMKDNKLTEWGSYLTSVKAAEYLMSTHNYIKSTTDELLLNDSDVLFIFDMYGSNLIKKDPKDIILDKWAVDNTYSIEGDVIENCKEEPFVGDDLIVINLYRNNNLVETYYSAEPLIKRLDTILHNDIAASVILRGRELRSIFAGQQKRTAREITDNLVRVRSSNVWAYGVEIKDNKAKEGDVYVQFKGKNGGPGDIYRYYDVPVTLWRRVLSASSKGHAIWKYLRNNFYYSKLTGDKRGVLPNAIN